MATLQATRPPPWRNVRVLRIAGQVAFVVVLVVVFREIWLNLVFNYQRIGVNASFDFLGSRAGFGIGESILDYTSNNSYLRAFLAGLSNTVLAIALPGIILASVLGVVMGVARLSTNWLVRKIAQVYVQALRNTPVLMVIIIMYVGIILPLPAIGGGLSIPGVLFLSNRGGAITWIRTGESFAAWLLFVGAAFVAAYLVRRWRTRVSDETGRPSYRFLWAAGSWLLVAAAGYAVTGGPLRFDVPALTERGFGYEGGMQMSPELAAVLIGLVLYTGAFIAEIIRGSIQAVSKGQKEAAQALGLTPFQQLRFVVLPQAMRIAIPPINSQYLNLTKNSTLAVAVGYPDFAGVAKTVINQSARSFQVIVVLLLTYLTLSLTISLFMNLINRRVVAKGER